MSHDHMKKEGKETVCILSNFNESEKKDLSEKIESIPGGVCIETSYFQSYCDLVICKYPNRGEKYLCGSVAGKTIVTSQYILDSYTFGEWIDEKPYEWHRQPLVSGLNEDLLRLPYRCKEYIKQNGGNRLFSHWKVLLCVADPVNRNAYKRLLEAGGALIINLKSSFGNLQHTLTHAFVTDESLKHVSLKTVNLQIILMPQYIAEYIVQKNPPDITKFQHYSNNCKNVPVKNVKHLNPLKFQSPKKSSILVCNSSQKTITELFNKKRKHSDDSEICSKKFQETDKTSLHLQRSTCFSPHLLTDTKEDRTNEKEIVTNLNSSLLCSGPKQSSSKAVKMSTQKLFNYNPNKDIFDDDMNVVNTIKLSSDEEDKEVIKLSSDEEDCIDPKPITLDLKNITCKKEKSDSLLLPKGSVSHKYKQSSSVINISDDEIEAIDVDEVSDSESSLNVSPKNLTAKSSTSFKTDLNVKPVILLADKSSEFNWLKKNVVEKLVNDVLLKLCCTNDKPANMDRKKSLKNQLVSKKKPNHIDEDNYKFRTPQKNMAFDHIPDIDFIRKTRKTTSQFTELKLPTFNEVNNMGGEMVFKCKKDALHNYPCSLVLHERIEYRGSKFLTRSAFPSRIESMVESCIDEQNLKNALNIIKQNLSGFYYPSAKIISRLLIQLSLETNVINSMELVCLLQQILLLHPVSKIHAVYDLALQRPFQDINGSVSATVTSWQFILEMFTNVTDCIQLDSDKSSLSCKLEAIKFICSLMEGDLVRVFPFGFQNSATPKCLEKLRKLLVWKVFWQNSQESITNSNVKDLIHLTFHLAVQAHSMQERVMLQQSLIILSLVAQCCSILDWFNSKTFYGRMCFNIVCEIQTKCEQILFSFNVSFELRAFLLHNLQPSWLSSRVADFLLQRYDCTFVTNKALFKSPLSLEKTICCYFFLYPRLFLKEEQHVPQKKNKKNLSETQSKVKNINKQNHKGETALHTACIRNNPDRVKELISMGANPNIKDNAGWYPLHEASNHGHVQCLKELLSYSGLDLYVTNNDGISALHDAVESNQLETAQFLLQVGGNRLISLQTKENKSAFDLAKTKEMKSLLNKYFKENGLFSSTSINDSKLNKRLYENVKTVSQSDLQEFLFLLTLLLKSLISTEEVSIDKPLLQKQFLLLNQHIAFISHKKTLQTCLLLKNLEKVLRLI